MGGRRVRHRRTLWLAALLAVLAAAIRLQYTPAALAMLGWLCLRLGSAPYKLAWARTHLLVAAVSLCLGVGLLDAAAWDATPFHSYWANIRYNAALPDAEIGSNMPAISYLFWLLLATCGGILLPLAASVASVRRYALPIVLILLTLAIHTMIPHKEYRFITLVIPCLLMIAADAVVRLAQSRPLPTKTARAFFAVVSVAGILNFLPGQPFLYVGTYTSPFFKVRFLHGHDSVFDAYRHLSRDPSVQSVWQADQNYASTPGYYHLHRPIPFYDKNMAVLFAGAAPESLASHIVSAGDIEGLEARFPAYRLDRTFGHLHVLVRRNNEAPIRRWRSYNPIFVGSAAAEIMSQVLPDWPKPPARGGVEWADETEGIDPKSP